jgi:hypothetical protein
MQPFAKRRTKQKKKITGPSKRKKKNHGTLTLPLPKCTDVPWYHFLVPGTHFCWYSFCTITTASAFFFFRKTLNSKRLHSNIPKRHDWVRHPKEKFKTQRFTFSLLCGFLPPNCIIAFHTRHCAVRTRTAVHKPQALLMERGAAVAPTKNMDAERTRQKRRRTARAATQTQSLWRTPAALAAALEGVPAEDWERT